MITMLRRRDMNDIMIQDGTMYSTHMILKKKNLKMLVMS
jgi:hypothetical protein